MSQAQSEVLTLTRQEFEAARANIYFIDSSVPDAEALALGLGEGSNVYMLDPTGDGLEQIANALQGQQVDAMHIYSHGRKGAIQLAGQWYDAAALDAAASTLARIGQSLNAGGDILLYGCNTASGSLGESFLERMARLASANVAASTDITGTGGDWQLEASAGTVDSEARQPDHWMGNLNTGDSLANWGVLEGTENNDTITGFVTNDRLYGQGGVDVLSGGQGHDIYYITGENSAGTRIVEKDLEGTDTVYSNVKDFTLGLSAADNLPSTESSSVEYIVLNQQEGFLSQNATGSSAAQTLVGNALSNRLTGGGGNDLLYGYDGDDYLDGGSGNLGLDGNNPLQRDVDYAISGDTVVHATMEGGKGNDSYIVRNRYDIITEKLNEGTDHVYSFLDYTLGANVENLTLLDGQNDDSLQAVKAYGNTLNNELRGNTLANTLSGDAGNDTLYGSRDGEAGDYLDGGAGNDAYYIYNSQSSSDIPASSDSGDGNDGSSPTAMTGDTISDSAGNDSIYASVNYSLADKPTIEHLFLQGNATEGTGNTLQNRIVGNENQGSTLDGGAGNDTLEGGYADDLFKMHNGSDTIIDKGGNNTVEASVTVDLNRFANARVQTVSLTGNANINATARRDVATSLFGNEGNNVLTGGTMNDTLDSGALGTNRLVGGAGDDVYVVRNSSTTVVEAAGAANGHDIVAAYVDHTLAANVEDLVLAQVTIGGTDGADEMLSGATIGTGNNLANRIDGSSITGGAILHGGVNNAGLTGDTLIGGTGNDQIYSYNANDSITFGEGSDVLFVSYNVAGGTAMSQDDWKKFFEARNISLTANTRVIYRGNPVGGTGEGIVLNGTQTATYLTGTDRADTLYADVNASSTLNGGKGGDSMAGGSGDDVFYVDTVGASSVKLSSQTSSLGDIVQGDDGRDTLLSSVSIDLNKTYSITDTDENGVPVAENEAQFTGIEAVSLLGTGNLTLKGYSDTGMSLMGNSGANQIWGGSESDYINGGAGADVMTGGDGDDVYEIDHASDRVVEKSNQGTDKIFTKGINIDLGKANYTQVERVENISTAKIGLTGTGRTDAGETLIGNSGNDTIDGKGGAADSLVGGTGSDSFFYYGGESINGDAYDESEGRSFSEPTDQDTLTVRKSFTGSLSLGSDVINIEKVLLETGTANQKAADVDASKADAKINIQGNTGNSTIIGSQYDDSLVGGGGMDAISGGLGNDFVEITANTAGYGVLDGGAGEDTLSFGNGADSVSFSDDGIKQTIGRTVVSLSAADFEVWSGGAGNDTLNASGLSSGIVLAGGLGVDQLIGGAGDDTLIADGGNDTFTTDNGHDVIRLTAAAAGSTIQVRDFDVTMDSLDDNQLRNDGWNEPSITQSGANATLIWTKGSQKITVVVQNCMGEKISFGRNEVVESGDFNAADRNENIPWEITAKDQASNITGGNKNDVLTSEDGIFRNLRGGAGDDSLTGRGGDNLLGESGNDTLTIADLGNTSESASLDGGTGDDLLLINSIGTGTASITGGDGQDTVRFGGDTVSLTFADDGTLDSISQGNAAVDVTTSGIEMHVGSAGADSVNATASTLTDSWQKSEWSHVGDIVYATGGGNDTYIGGTSSDEIYLHRLDSNSAVSLNGGGTEMQDHLYFATDQAVHMELDENESITSLAVDGQTLEHSTIQSFESYHLGDKGDTVIASSAAIAAVAKNAALNFNTNGGDDSIILGDVSLHHYVSADAGSGDDVVEVGAITSEQNFGKINLIGEAGDDTLRLDAPEGAGLYLRLGSSGAITENEGSLEYETKQGATTVAVGELSGFEHFDGSANTANTFDASNYTMHSGKLELTGGAGKDTFYLADMTGGSVTVTGRQDGQDDKLIFGGTQDVKLQLNAKGDINAVSMAGQKVSITATGLSAYEGGGGHDTLNAQAVTSVDNADKTMTLWGDGGNDVLYAGKIADGTFVLKASNGNDTLYDGAYGDRIELAREGQNDGNDSIIISGDYSGGSDTIVVTEQTSGSVTYITGFNKASDVLDDKDFMTAGWIRSAHTTDGRSGVTVTYTKKDDPTYSFDLQFTDIKTDPDIFLPGAVSVSDDEAYTIPDTTPGVIEVFGSSGNNTIFGGSQDGASIYGGGGNDNITGGNSNDSIVVTGGNYSVTAAGAKGNDTIVVNGDITGGVYTLYGENGSEPSEYGADTFYIAAIADTARVIIYGGSPIADDSTPDKIIFSATEGITVAPSSNQNASFYISGIDVLQGTVYNDSIDVSAVVVSGGDPGLTVYGGAGNDSLGGGNNQLLSGDAGDDLLILTGANTNVTLNGGDGNDTVTLNEQDKGLFLTLNSTGGISDSGFATYDTLTTNSPENTNITTTHVNISGVEHFDGSQNAANYFDARAYTMKSGSLGLYGGEGHDIFYLGNVQAGNVTLVGGEDTPPTNISPEADISTGDRFHIGNVGTAASIKIEAGTGDKIKDKLDFDGSQAVSLTLDATGDISSVSMNGQKVKITATGLSAYEGSNANDSIDASLVTSVDSFENNMTLEGGRGNDTIRTGNINGGIFYVEADAGADSIIGGAGTDHIALGDYEGDSTTDANGNTYLLSNDGGDTISTGGGSDVITVFEQKHGTRTTITDFDVKLDELNDSHLLNDGWNRTKGTTAGQNGTTLTYSKDSHKFYLQLTNVFDFSTDGVQKTSLNAGAQYTGSLHGDTITVNLGGNAPIYLNTNGAKQNGNRDMIYLNVNSSSPDTVTHVIEAPITDGTSAHARLYVNGTTGANIKFGETIGDVVRTDDWGSPKIVYTDTDSEIGDGRVVRAEESSSEGDLGYYIIDQGKVASMTELTVGGKTVKLNAWGFSKYYGTTGADSVDATGITDASVKIEYESQGGNDTYKGGSGIDMVHAISMNANTRMDFDGGEGNSDWLFLEGAKMTVALDSSGNISGLQYGTTSVANSKFDNFENFYFHEYDNFADSFDASDYVKEGSDSRTLAVTMGGGNDTIILNPDGNISSEKSFDAYGGTGNDLFRVGAVTTQTNSNTGICLNGGDGADTYALRAEGYALTIDETSEAEYDNFGNNIGSPDRIEFYGVQLQPGSESAFLSKLSFSLEDNGVDWNGNPLQILKISGVDSQSSSAALNFQSFDFTGDVMNFYDENGNKLLSGDIDIKSIVDTIQNNNSTSTNLSFTMGDDGKYKASS